MTRWRSVFSSFKSTLVQTHQCLSRLCVHSTHQDYFTCYIPCPSFHKKRPNSQWHGNRQITQQQNNQNDRCSCPLCKKKSNRQFETALPGAPFLVPRHGIRPRKPDKSLFLFIDKCTCLVSNLHSGISCCLSEFYLLWKTKAYVK